MEIIFKLKSYPKSRTYKSIYYLRTSATVPKTLVNETSILVEMAGLRVLGEQ